MDTIFRITASLALVGVGFVLYFWFFTILMFMISSSSEQRQVSKFSEL